MEKIYNISFKYGNQTRTGEDGTDFIGGIKLGHFVNLWTGKLIT